MQDRFSWICQTLALTASLGVPGTAQNYTIYIAAGGGFANQVPATNVGVQRPVALATDPAGNLYVGTLTSAYKVDNAGVLTVLAETSADAIAVDSAGNVYIANGGCIVQKVVNGVLIPFAGNGTCGFSGDHGLAVNAELYPVVGLAVDSSGDLYITDDGSARVRKVSNGIITTFAGNGSPTPSGNGGLATNAGMFPSAIAVDGNGNVYIADHNADFSNTIRVISGGIINNFAGGGSSENDGPANSAQLYVADMAFNSSNNLYFSDYQYNRVRVVSSGIVSTIVGCYPAGSCVIPASPSPVCDGCAAIDGSLLLPAGLAFDTSGTLYIADEYHNRVRSVSGGVIETVVGNGKTNIGDGIEATADTLYQVGPLAVDASSNIYITDGDRVREISKGTISTIAGSVFNSAGFSGNGGPASNALFSNPSSVAVDGLGNIYVADTFNNQVRKISTTGTITAFAGNNSNVASGDAGPATSAGLPNPMAVAVDTFGNVYIASSYSIRKVSSSTGIITTIAGTGIHGFSGDNGPATAAQLFNPIALAVDSHGNVYVVDSARIREISNGTITTIAGNNAFGYSGDGGPATAAYLDPYGVAVDSAGNIYTAEYSRVRRISDGVINTIAGVGSPIIFGYAGGGFSGNGGPALDASFFPSGLSIDLSGRIYVSDSANSLIWALVPSSTAIPRFGPPNLLSLSPSSAPVGTSLMTLTVTGSGFASGNTVLWNGSALPTTFVSGTTLMAAVSPGLFSAVGTALVSVGASNSLTFTITGPGIRSLSPSSIGPGASTFTLTVTGLNFVSGSAVIFNGTPLTTIFNSSTQLTATVPASLVANQGTVLVYVLNLNTASNEVAFVIGTPQLQCTASGGVPPTLRFEGEAELLGDLLLNCTSFQGGQQLTTAVTVFGNIPLTSRILNSSTNASEVLLLIDDPAPAQQVLNQNVFQGIVDGPDIVFPSVPITTPNSGSTRKLRIVNLRADAHAFGLGSSSVQPADVAVELSNVSVTNGVQTLGFVAPTDFQTSNLYSSNDQRSVRLSYTEGFATAFKTRVAPGGQQSMPGTIYNTESGFVNTALLPGAGLADNGTRLFLQITGVPAGVTAYVSVHPEGSTDAQLVSTDGNGVGPLSPIAGSSLFGGTYSQVPISNGSGIAVWEVTSANLAAIETLTFDLVLTGMTQAGLGPVVLGGTLAPFSPIDTTSSSAPLPRFAPDSLTGFVDLTLLSGSSGTSAGFSSRSVGLGKGATATTTSSPPPSVQAGSPLPFSFKLLNNGPRPATQVTVTSTLPPGISFVPGSCTLQSGTVQSGTCTATTNADLSTTVTGQYSGSFPPGQAPSEFSFMATPTQVSSQLMSVISQLSSSQTDSNPDDNTVVTSFTVVNSAPPPVTVQFASSPANIPILNGSNQPLTSLTLSQYGMLPNFSVVSPQTGPNGAQYAFNSWSDGNPSAVRNNVPVPIGGGTFRAFFDTQYPINVTTSGKGTVSFTPSAGSNYFTVGASVQIQATAAPGYSFSGFSGDVTSMTNPLPLVAPSNALNITATFAPGGAATNAGIFRQGFLWVLDVDGNQKTNIPPDLVYAFGGIPGDIPIAGDWTGDGHTKIGIYRPGNGLFILDSNGNGILDAGDAVFNLHIGKSAGDIPVVGDWNGDGRSKVGYFRQGFLWILDTNGNHIFEQGIDQVYAYGGVAGDIPVVGDWTGTGTSKIGVFRQGFLWVLDANGNGTFDGPSGGDLLFPYGGIPGDVPVAGDWKGTGITQVGIFRQGFLWALDANGDRLIDSGDFIFGYGGIPGDIPVVGKW